MGIYFRLSNDGHWGRPMEKVAAQHRPQIQMNSCNIIRIIFPSDVFPFESE